LILRTPSLASLSILPVGITLTLYFVVISKAKLQVNLWLASALAAHGWNSSPWLLWVAHALASLGILVVGAVTFSFVSSIVASPFNDFLAERTERFVTPPLSPTSPLPWHQKLRLIWLDLSKTVAATTATLLALTLSWVPGLNIIALLLAFLLMSFQFTSYPQTRRGVTLRQGLSFLFQHAYACAGLGATLTLLFSIPLISSLSIPLAVVSGTLLVARAQCSAPSSSLYSFCLFRVSVFD
jgi:uncharacterized protein involved in cysteine biosynthesis